MRCPHCDGDISALVEERMLLTIQEMTDAFMRDAKNLTVMFNTESALMRGDLGRLDWSPDEEA